MIFTNVDLFRHKKVIYCRYFGKPNYLCRSKFLRTQQNSLSRTARKLLSYFLAAQQCQNYTVITIVLLNYKLFKMWTFNLFSVSSFEGIVYTQQQCRNCMYVFKGSLCILLSLMSITKRLLYYYTCRQKISYSIHLILILTAAVAQGLSHAL